jgi:hypothetical protein
MKKMTSDNLKISVVSSCVVLLLALTYQLSGKIELVVVFSVGLLLVGGAVAGVVFLSKHLEKRKTLKAREAAAADGRDLGKAKEKLEALRKSFFEGLEKFTSAGRDLYEIPWYLMVGLSGVGKTEAIRHSGLTFPPNLMDTEQGEGGTHTLSWWFTKEAVILDTVGEWLLGESDDLSEWIEFVRLLKSHRPLCPFNGIILAISAESLVMDDEEKIKGKAAKIASKLDKVQRTLELRFPVFVVVTKCDLITGFREFFPPEADPQSQAQMLGWSNPAGLDEPVSFDKMDGNLRAIFEALRRQRQNLLDVEAEGKARLSMDLLFRQYAFPENMARLVPKLRVYLEAAFQAGEWSAKPLFLRGIYFTSAKQEGWELDAELGESFPLPESALIEEANPGRHRTHFLLDLFTKKVFLERGLVLRAASAKSHQRRKFLLTWGVAFVALVAFILITGLSINGLQDAIGTEQDHWATAAGDAQWKKLRGQDAWRPVVAPAGESGGKYMYTGGDVFEAGTQQTVGEFLGMLTRQADRPLDIPWIFKMSAGIQGNLNRHRAIAGRALFESSVLMPLVDAAREKILREKPETWTPHATPALAELLRLEIQKTFGPPKASEGPLLGLDALFHYVLQETPAEYENFKQLHAETFQKVLGELYGAKGDAEGWPPSSLGAGSETARKVVEQGCSLFVLHWVRQIESQKVNTYLRDVAMLTEAGESFLRGEVGLLEVKKPFLTADDLPSSLLIHNRVTGEWEKHYATLADARIAIRQYIGAIATGSLEAAYDTKGARAIEEVEAAFNAVLVQLAAAGSPDAPAAGAGKDADGGILTGLDRELRAKLGELKATFLTGKMRERIRRLDGAVYKVVSPSEFGRQAVRAYETRFEIYKLAHELVLEPVPVPNFFTFPASFGKSGDAILKVRERIEKKVKISQALDPQVLKTGETALLGCDLAQRLSVYAQIKSALDAIRNAKTALAEQAAKRAEAFEPVQRVRILMTASTETGNHFRPAYHPLALKEALKSYRLLVGMLGDPEKPDEEPAKKALEHQSLSIEFRQVDKTFKEYFHGYTDYWVDVVRRGFSVRSFRWNEFVARLGEVSQWDVNTTLAGTLNVVEDALKDGDLPLDARRKATVEKLRKDIKKGRDRIKSMDGKDSPFILKCKQVVTSWSRLKSESSEAARLILLKLTPEALMEKYILQGSGESRDMVVRYWEGLTYETLNSLASDFQSIAEEQLENLPKYRYFPLAAPGGDKMLSAKEVGKCREVFDLVRPNPANLPKGSIGLGARTDVDRLDVAVRRLAWLEMPRGLRTWIEKADRILAALPLAGRDPLSCEIVLLNAKWQKDLCERKGEKFESVSVLPIWRSITIIQGPRTVAKREGTGVAEDKVLGSIEYPGAKLRIEFFKAPSDKIPDGTIQEPADWGCLLLLHHNLAQLGKDGTWTVPLTLKDAKGFERKIWLQFRFEKPLPDLGDWPRRS